MSWVATAIIGGAVIGGVSANRAADTAADATQAGVDASVGEQRRQFDLTREDLRPTREAGNRAIGRLDRLQSGDFSDFFTSPGFEFVRDEGLRGIENRFSASGGSLSGNALRRLTEFNSGLASREFGNFFERDSRIAGLGGAATNAGVAAGQNSANNISNAFLQGGAITGNARASGVQGVNDAIQGGISNFFTARQAGLFDPPTPRRLGVGGI